MPRVKLREAGAKTRGREGRRKERRNASSVAIKGGRKEKRGTFHAGHIDYSLIDASHRQGLRDHEEALLHSQGLRHIPEIPMLGREEERRGRKVFQEVDSDMIGQLNNTIYYLMASV